MDIDREVRRHQKIARSLIRLKHSLAADDEIYEVLQQQKDALKNGVIVRVDTTLKELLGQ